MDPQTAAQTIIMPMHCRCGKKFVADGGALGTETKMRAMVLALAGVLLAVACPRAGAAPGVGPQYESTHVYVPPEEFDRFVTSFLATFGGSASKKSVATVTPTPSRTFSQLVLTPVGTLSVFGYETPIPYPFGAERTGYLVTDLDAAVKAARADGAAVVVAPFPDPIGRDVVIQWPGGVNMQLYIHFAKPNYAAFQAAPENRVYLSADAAPAFLRGFLAFSHGKVVSDDSAAPGAEIGRPGETFREVRITSAFGRLTALITDGHLPYPYGRETTGYEVQDLDATLARATASGASVLVPPYASRGRTAALVRFPGGYVAEIHAPK